MGKIEQKGYGPRRRNKNLTKNYSVKPDNNSISEINMKLIRACFFCGKEFKVNITNKKKIYCSDKCRHKQFHKIRPGYNKEHPSIWK